MITIEPKDNPISSDASNLPNTSTKSSRISLDFKQLAYYSLPVELRESVKISESENAQKINLEKIVDITHDLCFNLAEETNSIFKVHKASL